MWETIDKMTDEELKAEAEAIMKEVEENREELEAIMKELPPDFFDKMHDELMEKIRQKEQKDFEDGCLRLFDFVFRQ